MIIITTLKKIFRKHSKVKNFHPEREGEAILYRSRKNNELIISAIKVIVNTATRFKRHCSPFRVNDFSGEFRGKFRSEFQLVGMTDQSSHNEQRDKLHNADFN